jgi:16S rRNA processing protein RimM
MGRVLSPYGVHGWIKARAFTAVADGLLGYKAWWLTAADGRRRRFAVLEARMHAGALVARLEGLSGREEAALWRGATIAVPREALPALAAGEFYLMDLVGLDVVDRSGVRLGRVIGVLETGAHPVLRVGEDTKNDGVERLIPIVPAYVEAIDLAAGRISVDWGADY